MFAIRRSRRRAVSSTWRARNRQPTHTHTHPPTSKLRATIIPIRPHPADELQLNEQFLARARMRSSYAGFARGRFKVTRRRRAKYPLELFLPLTPSFLPSLPRRFREEEEERRKGAKRRALVPVGDLLDTLPAGEFVDSPAWPTARKQDLALRTRAARALWSIKGWLACIRRRRHHHHHRQRRCRYAEEQQQRARTRRRRDGRNVCVSGDSNSCCVVVVVIVVERITRSYRSDILRTGGKLYPLK